MIESYKKQSRYQQLSRAYDLLYLLFQMVWEFVFYNFLQSAMFTDIYKFYKIANSLGCSPNCIPTAK